MPFGRLEVIIAEARNLKGGTFLDKADPYVTVSTDRQNIQKTSVMKNAGENASWNQNFYFDIVEGRNELYVQVYDENTGSDDLIGSTTIQLGPLFQSAYADTWFPITKQDGKNSGNIHVIMKFSPQGAAPGPGYTPPIYQGTPGFSSLGPQSGPLPTGYGVGTPPPPGQPGYPPAQPTGYYQQQQPYGTPQPPQQPYGTSQPGGYPGGVPPSSDSGSPYGAPYGSQPTPSGSVPPPQSAGYSGQPTYPGSSPYGAPPQNASYGGQSPAVYPGSVAPSSSSSSSSKGNKGGTDWLATAGIGVAGAAALTGAAFLGKKLFDEHEEKKHEREEERIDEEVRHSMNEYGQPHYGQPHHGGYEHERHEHHEKHHHKHHHHY